MSAAQTDVSYIRKFNSIYNKDSLLKKNRVKIWLQPQNDRQTLTLYVPVVTLFTTWCIITFFINLPDYIHVLCVDLRGGEVKTIIQLYSTKWMVFITEMESVYCAVRAEYLYIIQADFRP